MPYGRGGAGNFEAQQASQQQYNSRVSADLESQQQDAENALGDKGFDVGHQDTHRREWAHMGRGGAGNYYSPKDLSEKGRFEGAASSHVLGDGTPAPRAEDRAREDNGMGVGVSGGAGGGETAAKRMEEEKKKGPAPRGRGGAGNFSYGVTQSEEVAYRRRVDEEEMKKQNLRGEIERGVEEGLRRPEQAKLAGGEPF